MSKKTTGTANAFAFLGEKVPGMETNLSRFKAENAKRRPCPICHNLALPAKMDQHKRAFHP